MPASIFVVDDEAAIRMTLSQRLGRQQHQVRTFDSGESLLEGLAKGVPDLILLDLRLPQMSGIQALKLLRQKAPDTLVIMMTAYCTPTEAVEVMKQGAYDLVIKSGDLSEAAVAVNGALESLASRRRADPGT